MSRLPIVGVMGSASTGHEALAGPLGRLIADLGCHLLTGGRTGVMEAVGRAFCAVRGRPGSSIGVLPEGAKANPYVEIPIYTQLSAENDMTHPGWRWSRNHINVRTSTVIVALPGGPGTASELELATGGAFARPCVAYLGERGAIGALPRSSDGTHIVTSRGHEAPVARSLDDVQAFIEKYTQGARED